MKTLDEVIKAFECCENGDPDSNCKECSYIGIGFCCLERKNDALHYLKEYQLAQNLAKLGNDPLTWDELKAMKGKPIWVEDNIDGPKKSIKCWAICRGIEKTQITEYALLCDFCYDKAEYGKTWQVYRKEKV